MTHIQELRAEKLDRQRRRIMHSDQGHLGKYPDPLAPGEPVDPNKLLAGRFLGHERA